MTDATLFIYILIVHWLLDFVAQTNYQAQNKSKDFIALISHTLVYSMGWITFLIFYTIYVSFEFPFVSPLNFKYIIHFGAITFITHTIIDYFTSRLSAKLFAQKDYHNFFVCIGFDQILHYIQLWFTFKLLF